MDSWSYGTSQGKGGFGISNDASTSFTYDDNSRMESSMELGFFDVSRKPLLHNSYGGFLDGKVGSGIGSSSISGEESSSRFSSNVGDSNGGRDSLFIDLKLGRIGDCQDVQIGKLQKEAASTSSAVSSLPEKRARSMTLTYQNPVCQVHGCNMDLTNSKEYHKRHKVCDAHSKTAKVIVNGIEQRFCQQCSRFHLLAEFDDGKRSCRKRLAGHNERRRKPHLDGQNGRTSKHHLSYNGSRFLGASLPMRSSFMGSNIFQSSSMQPVKYEPSNWFGRVKVEEEEFYSPHQVTPLINEHLVSRTSLPLFGGEKHYSSFHGNGLDTTTRSSFCENSNRYSRNFPETESTPRFMFRSAPSGGEDTVYDSASTIEGLSGASDSGSALSLLSSQSQNSSNLSSGFPMAQPLLIQEHRAYYNLDQFSGKLFEMNSQASTSSASNRFSSSMTFDRFTPLVASDASNSVDFDIHGEGIFQRSEFMTTKGPLSHEHSATVDLLQLSSQLQRVEQQRNSMQVKHESDTFCCLPHYLSCSAYDLQKGC